MAMDKETQVSASTILDKDIYNKLKEICKKDKRSVSSQISILVDNFVAKQSSNLVNPVEFVAEDGAPYNAHNGEKK